MNKIPDSLSSFVNKLSFDTIEIAKLNHQKLVETIALWVSSLKKQRQLIDLPDKKILIVGDIHGDFKQLNKALRLFDEEKYDFIIFNGDLIDRGPEMIECLLRVMTKQLLKPDKVFYLRGNHELKSINEFYGFRGYCTGVYGSQIYEAFSNAFQQLPIASKIGDFGFVCHGGIPNSQIFFHMMRLEPKIAELESGPYAQLLWNDPDPEIEGFASSFRGPNFYRFGKKAFDSFMEFHQLSIMVRSHQAFKSGFKWFFDNRLISVFSSQAGPYSKISPHFASVYRKEIDLIPCSDLE